MNSSNSLKKKCAMCNKNVGICGLDCRCNKHLCIKHLLPELHMCDYDYKTEQLKQLKIDNPLISSVKLNKV